jgi:hypothetical protein
MKKFVFLYGSVGDQTPESMQAWMSWFDSIGGNLVDPGNPFGPGRVVTADGVTDAGDDQVVSGYTIVNAESIEAAEKLLDGHPMVQGIRIYEALPM